MTDVKPTLPLFLDCDTGIDDAVAIAYLLASPGVRLIGVGTVGGNTSAAQGAVNTLDLLALGGVRDVPVAVGANDWLTAPFDGGSPAVHGDNGVGDVALPASGLAPAAESAVDLLLRLSHEHAGELALLAIGPLTNIALALEKDPTLVERVASVTVMGGAALVPGNVTPVAEANIWHDPEAAQAVVAADWDVTLVPLDVTMENVMDEEHRARMLASASPIAEAVARTLDHYFDFYQPIYGRRCSALHDPLAAAIAIGEIRATVAPAVPVVVDTTDGPGRGQTIADLRAQRSGTHDRPGCRTRVVLATDRPLAEHMIERIVSGA